MFACQWGDLIDVGDDGSRLELGGLCCLVNGGCYVIQCSFGRGIWLELHALFCGIIQESVGMVQCLVECQLVLYDFSGGVLV